MDEIVTQIVQHLGYLMKEVNELKSRTVTNEAWASLEKQLEVLSLHVAKHIESGQESQHHLGKDLV